MEYEKNRASGRMRRYARVGSAAGGLTARLLGQRYLGLPSDSSKNATELKQVLGNLKGPLMKVAQLLATIPDGLPEDYINELRELQSQAPAMGWAFVKRRMTTELGSDWHTLFDEFSQKASAAASLGQVHKALSKEGYRLACKLQYPNMESTVEADLKQLKILFALYRRYDSAIDTSQIFVELTARLREELDYHREAMHISLYGHILKNEPGVNVPEVYKVLSTRRLLTMSWLDGDEILKTVSLPEHIRNQVATNMFTAWYLPFYQFGILHGDPHLGNYSICEDGSVNLLDFGCIRIFPSEYVQGLIHFYRGVQNNDRGRMLHAFENWGFQNLSCEMVDALSIWAKYIYGPLTDDRCRLIDESGSGKFGGSVAMKVHKEIRRLGVVTPPREFVLLDRSAIGLGSVFLHLSAKLNWHRAFEELIDKFDSKTLASKQESVLKYCHVPNAA